MNIHAIDYNRKTNDNAGNPAFTYSVPFRGIENLTKDKSSKKEKASYQKVLASFGFAFLGVGVVFLAIKKCHHLKKWNTLSKKLSEDSIHEVKKAFKMYHPDTKGIFIRELSKNEQLEKVEPKDIELLVRRIAIEKNIKSLSEETFADKFDRLLDIFL